VLNRGYAAPNWFRECRDATPDHDERGSVVPQAWLLAPDFLRDSLDSKRSTTRLKWDD